MYTFVALKAMTGMAGAVWVAAGGVATVLLSFLAAADAQGGGGGSDDWSGWDNDHVHDDDDRSVNATYSEGIVTRAPMSAYLAKMSRAAHTAYSTACGRLAAPQSRGDMYTVHLVHRTDGP